ncbi:uncharacterized protein si:dkeyp-121d4.3 isoform X2 [Hoplias malabaricus]|uniref:uncharacterized protein si:dkeyp-121d4.3 isoform X2 n=1 Tax=Hoplias malabaricus TaxID=27720 RepID=UPI0034622BB5
MSKGRKRKGAPPNGNGPPPFMMPPPGGPPPPDACWGGPPHPGGFPGPMGPPRPRIHGQHFPMHFPRPPMMEEDPYMDEPPDFLMREDFRRGEFGAGPGYPPPPFDYGPRFPHPDFDDRPPDYLPPEFDGGPREFEGRPPGFVPPEFRGGPPPFRPPGFHPPVFEEGPPLYPPMEPAHGPVDNYGAMNPKYAMPPMGDPGDDHRGRGGFFIPPPDHMGRVPGATMVQDIVTMAPPLSAQPASKQTKSEITKTEASKTITAALKTASKSVKPPPGRSFGVISFIGNNYGFIEREDLKKFSFSFDAYFGSRTHLVPGVKVHFTAIKELGKECAADVKVAPGGTDEVEETIYEGVVITPLPETYVPESHPGCIRTILSTDPVKLPFGKSDTKATLLLFDRVKFQLLTDIITKDTRATNITPQIPETFLLTKEIREKGVIMNKYTYTYSIMSKKHENVPADIGENFSEDELNVMDEVEFTPITVKDKVKAIRLKKLPKGSVVFDSQTKNKIAEAKNTDSSAGKDKWKPVTSGVVSEDISVNEEVSSEKYQGTILQVIPKNFQKEGNKQKEQSENPHGLLDSSVAGTQKSLPFRSSDIITQATMMVGDKVLFNLSINKETKEQRAVNIEIQPDSLLTDSAEQRKTGVILKLDDNSGLIKTPQDPELFFDMSEVMEATKLTVSDKVEFTLFMNGAEGDKRAIRIRRLTESVFTSVPKLEAFGDKEKKKTAIKLLSDTKEEIRNEVKNDGSVTSRQPEKGKDETSKADKPTKTQKQDIKAKQDKGNSDRDHSRSRDNSRRRSRSHSRDRSSSHYRRHRSSSRERSHSRYRRSRSRSKDRGHRHKHSRSRSRSRERNSRSVKKRSRSPDYKGDYRSSKERSSKRRSRSPDKNEGKSAASSSVVEDELARKRRELLELNELIARKRAIVAMEQNTKSFKDVLEMDRQQGFATFDYQHKTCQENTWIPDMKPAKSILKKHSEPPPDPKLQASKKSPEPAEYPKKNTTNPYSCSVPEWAKQSSVPETEDQEIAKKKKQLQDLCESIARKRAIVAMEQKAKAISDEPEVKKEYNFASCSDGLDISTSVKNNWRLDVKPEPQPKKSILKKRSEPPANNHQSDMSSVNPRNYGHDLFSICKPPQDDFPAFSKPSVSCPPVDEKSTNPSNTVDIFKKLINDVSSTSCRNESLPFTNQHGPRSFSPLSNSGSFYCQKSTAKVAEKDSCLYEDRTSESHSRNPLSSYPTFEQSPSSSCSSAQPSNSEQKRNLSTQMQRFLSALNKADSNLLSSLLREARKDSASLGNQQNPQLQTNRKGLVKDELYDPFKETENDEAKLMESRKRRNPIFGKFEDHSDDDLLPHERAVQDGSGFSKIVGMKYGKETNAENQFLYKVTKATNSQSKFSEDQKRFSELPRDRYSDFEHLKRSVGGYQNPHVQELYTENREQYDRQSEGGYVVGGAHTPLKPRLENSSEDIKKSENFEKLQNLLQTIGLKLDTAEVSKLADRTRERLYGKKVKSQSASSHSFTQKDEQSASRYDRKGSRADSSDSEGVRSVTPTKSSKREVYMSYLDSIMSRDKWNEAAIMKEKDLVNIKRTIKNSPEARQVTPDSNKYVPSTSIACDPYKPSMEIPSTSVQTVSVVCTQRESPTSVPYVQSRQNSWESTYHFDEDQKGNSQEPVSPYALLPPSPLQYPAGMQVPPPSLLPVYGAYTQPPVLRNPPPFSTPPPFCPPPPPMFPPLAGQFDMSMLPGGPGYIANQAKIKPTTPARCLKTIEMVRNQDNVKPVHVKPTLANVQPALISIQPVEEILLKDSQGEDESKQAAPITEEDIKAKQKKRLEQFNQRMRLKKEQQMEAQRTRGQSQKPTPGKVTQKELKNVWICGHSLVFWAEKRATSPEFGMQLGMDPNSVRIWWKGVQGMTWQQLLPQLLQLKDNWPKPDVILIHLGGNDIGMTTTEAFLASVKKDLISMKSIFPECLLVWSDILPRRSWRHSNDSEAVDNTRMAINKSVCKILTELGGSSISHEDIMPGLDTGLYRPDGVHLSGKGIDTFNLNLQDFLEKWESEINVEGPSEL